MRGTGRSHNLVESPGSGVQHVEHTAANSRFDQQRRRESELLLLNPLRR
jgi:hypothetical protein